MNVSSASTVVEVRGIDCERCKQKSLKSACACACGVLSKVGKPERRLQNMHEEILYLICEYLQLADLVSFITVLPKVIEIHGLYKQWSLKYWSKKDDFFIQKATFGTYTSRLFPLLQRRYIIERALRQRKVRSKRLFAELGYI